jgi:hypothetical protein
MVKSCKREKEKGLRVGIGERQKVKDGYRGKV